MGRRVTWLDAVIGYAAVAATWWLFVTYAPGWIKYAPHVGPYAYHLCDAVVPLFFYLVLRRRFPIGALNWNELRGWMWPLVSAVCAMALTFAATMLIGFGSQLRQAFDISLAGFVFSAVAPGLGEEFLWRGLIQSGLDGSLNVRVRFRGYEVGLGTLITALAFGAAHLGNLGAQPFQITIIQATSATAGGLILGIGYERTQNLWGAIIAHNVADLFLLALIASFAS